MKGDKYSPVERPSGVPLEDGEKAQSPSDTGATTPVRPQSYIMAPEGRPYEEEVLLEP